MSDLMNPRLAKWEIETIEALAQEDLTRLSAKEYVQFPERLTETFIATTQERVLTDAKERKRLVAQADRLGIGFRRPPKVAELQTEPYDVASHETGARWVRLIGLVFREPFDADWRLMHEDVVTAQVRQERETGIRWMPDYGGQGQLELLEEEALRMGLIEGEAPVVNARAAVLAMARAIGGVVA